MDGLPQTNPYDYGLDDPIGVIDPAGQFGVIGAAAIGAGAVAAGALIYSIYNVFRHATRAELAHTPGHMTQKGKA
jgi:hypothetical protein